MASADEIASAATYITDDVGLEVTDGSHVRVQIGNLGGGDYGLKVISADGSTVIIDGTSDIFKIATSFTTSATRTGIGSVQSLVGVGGFGLPNQAPSFTAYLTEGTAPLTSDNRNLGWFHKTATGFVAGTSGGSPTNGAMYDRWVAQVLSYFNTVPAIALQIDCGEAAPTVAAAFARVYVFAETAI